MAELLVRPSDPDEEGRVTHITPRTAGWGHVGFDLYKLEAGQRLSRETGTEEHWLVLVAGPGEVTGGGAAFGGLGRRATPRGLPGLPGVRLQGASGPRRLEWAYHRGPPAGRVSPIPGSCGAPRPSDTALERRNGAGER